jgi:hypothetical protein
MMKDADKYDDNDDDWSSSVEQERIYKGGEL